LSSKPGSENRRGSGISQALRGAVFGTPLEGAARTVWSLSQYILPTERAQEFRRGARYDRMTIEIARHVLGSSSNAIDAGANAGTVLKHLVRLAPTGTHFAVEPIPYLARRLARRYPAVSVHEVALADYEGTASFRSVREDPALSSLLIRPDREVDTHVEEINVDVRRLDDIVPAHLPIAFLKVDVEGGESSLFRGAIRILREWQPVIVFESEIESLRENAEILGGAGLGVHLLEDHLAGRRRSSEQVAKIAANRGDFMFAAARD
jgi:FkbM family methyltransferase